MNRLCPSSNFPEDIEPPKVEVLSLFLKEADSEQPSIFNGIFELEEKLNDARLDLMVKRGIITRVVMGDSIADDAFFLKCPKLPAGTEARIGVRRDLDLRNIVFKTNGLVDNIKNRLIHSDAIRFAFIFGSFARKEETSSSDIDLMVVGDLDLRQLTKMLSGLTDKLYREINPHCLSQQDFIRRKNLGEPFINTICEEAKLFIIGDENDSDAMV